MQSLCCARKLLIGYYVHPNGISYSKTRIRSFVEDFLFTENRVNRTKYSQSNPIIEDLIYSDSAQIHLYKLNDVHWN